MRFVFALAAGVLWIGLATAQPYPGAASGVSSSEGASAAPSSNEPTAPTDAQNQPAQQAVDHNNEVVCHSVTNAGSRLSRHTTRVCKTRQQWEFESQRDQQDLHSQGVQGTQG